MGYTLTDVWLAQGKGMPGISTKQTASLNVHRKFPKEKRRVEISTSWQDKYPVLRMSDFIAHCIMERSRNPHWWDELDIKMWVCFKPS